MDRGALERLFSVLVARRAGVRSRTPDMNAHSAANLLCAGVDVRAHWTPDAAFFGLLPSEDLRRLAVNLVPGIDVESAARMARRALVASLDCAFADAKSGQMDQVSAQRLNAWVPGILSFPAIVATGEDDPAQAADAEAALFAAF